MSDVKLNTKPDIPTLDLKTLLNDLTPVHHKWRKICIQLGIPNSQLLQFEKDDDPIIASLDYWLNGNTDVPITWRSMVAALESASVGEHGLAKVLREKYCMEITNKASKQTEMNSSTPETKQRFPYLEITELTEEQKDKLIQRLTLESDEIKAKFAILVSRTTKSLEKNHVSVDNLKITLKNLGLNELVEKLHDESDLNKALIKASDYWSFFEYETVTSIISSYCKDDDDLQQEVESYISSFKIYCQRRLCEVPIDNFETEMHKKTMKLYVKMDETFNISLNEVKKIEAKLSVLLDTDLYLCKVEEGCIELIFSCLRKIKLPFSLNSQQKEDLLKMGVVRLYYDDICEYYHALSQDKSLSQPLQPSQLPAVKQLFSSMSPLEMSELSLELNDLPKESQPDVETMEDEGYQASIPFSEMVTLSQPPIRPGFSFSTTDHSMEASPVISANSDTVPITSSERVTPPPPQILSPGMDGTENSTEASSSNRASKDFQEQLNNLEQSFHKIVDQIQKKHEFFHPIEHSDIHKDSEIEAYFSILYKHWDFTFIENLVNKSEDKDLISRMQDFKNKLKEFCHKTRLCDFTNYCTKFNKKVSEDDLKELVVKLNQNWKECTLENLEMLQESITHKFFLPPYSMTIEEIGVDSIIIKWSIPTENATSLEKSLEKTDIREFCKENGIESIILDRKECLYLPSRAYLKDLYSTKEGKNLAPFKLAKVKEEVISRSQDDEFTKDTFRGDQDDVVHKKYPMKVDEVCHLTDQEKTRLVLIEGAPGVGKTTFSEQYCYNWSRGKCLNDHTLLLLLPLRDSKIKSVKTVSKLFQRPYLKQDIAQEVENSQGEGIAIWLEAWDELEESMREESSIFLDLVHGRVLPKATIIVTGRPWATMKIRDNSDITVDQHIEIVSTPKIQFSRVLEEKKLKTENLKKFKDYVNSNPSVKAAMHTPVTADIVTEVFQWSQDTESRPPITMTKLYNAYTCKLLMQHLSRRMEDHRQSHNIRSLEDVPPDLKKELQAICKLAWEGIVERRLTFTSNALSVGTLGLMQEVKELHSGEDIQLSYHFIHLTLQEFLSAYHICQLPLEKQQQIIQEHKEVGHLNTVVKFYFGLCKHNDLPSSKVISPSISSPSSYQWLFECEYDAEQISKVLCSGDHEPVSVRSSYEWSPLDYYCLGYCISHSQCQWKLDFSSASMGDEGVEMFCNGILSNRQVTWNGKILRANFNDNDITEKGIKSLVQVPPTILQKINKLYLGKNKLNENALDVFSKIIPELTSLQVLSLSRNSIGDRGAVKLIRTLCDSKTPLRHLYLNSTDVSENCCTFLVNLLSSTDLKKLDISKNNLSSSSVAFTMNGIQQRNTIETLEISASNFSKENCTSLASVLQKPMCQLKWLDIENCQIKSDGAIQLAAGLTNNKSLENIYLSDNPIGEDGAVALGEAITNNVVLKILYMCNCEITSKGFAKLASSLSKNTKLQTLWISDNQTGIEGARAVSKMIAHNKTLKELSICSDDSLEKEIDIIVSSLQSNTSLKQLCLPKKFKRPEVPIVRWL